MKKFQDVKVVGFDYGMKAIFYKPSKKIRKDDAMEKI